MLKMEDILSHEGLENLFSVATYGNGWPYVHVKESDRGLVGENDEWVESKWASVLLKGGTLIVEDLYAEEGDKDTYELTLEGVKKGLEKMKEEYPRHWADLVEENDDLITGDCFLQLAVFGEWIYG